MSGNMEATGVQTPSPSMEDAVNAAFDAQGSTAPASTPADASSPQSPTSPTSAQGVNTTPPPAPIPEATRLSDADMAKLVEIERSGGVKKTLTLADVLKEHRGAHRSAYETHMANLELSRRVAEYEAQIAELQAARAAVPPPQGEELFDPYAGQTDPTAPLDPKAFEKIAESVATRVLTQAQQEAYARQQEQAFAQTMDATQNALAQEISADPVLSKMNAGKEEYTRFLAVKRAKDIFNTPGALTLDEYNAYYTDPSALIRQVLSSMRDEEVKAKETAKQAWLAETKQQIKDAGAPRLGGVGGLAPMPTVPKPANDADLRAEIERQYDALMAARGR